MVQTLLAGLPAHGVPPVLVPWRLSPTAADIGRWQPAKPLRALRAALAARRLARREGCDTLYYVPAPGKRGALWRDLLALRLVRPVCPRLVLHWHASGLGAWLQDRATAAERHAAQRVLGRAALSVVLGEALRADAAYLHPCRIAVVANGIADPCPDFTPRRAPPAGAPIELLYLGLCSEEKGLFATLDALALANRHARFHLTIAGDFATDRERRRFATRARALGDAVRPVGFVAGEAKQALLRQSQALVFPTRYPHEAQSLVVLEALAHDLPVLASRWRALPESLPADYPHLLPDTQPETIAAHLLALAQQPPPAGALRRHFLTHFTDALFLLRFVTALASLDHP